MPGQFCLDASAREDAHGLPPRRVIHKLGDGARELELVGGACVHRRRLRREAMLGQVEGDDWFSLGHVLQHLGHGRAVVKGIRWVRIHANIGTGDIP